MNNLCSFWDQVLPMKTHLSNKLARPMHPDQSETEPFSSKKCLGRFFVYGCRRIPNFENPITADKHLPLLA
jgi:hypothetical protein